MGKDLHTTYSHPKKLTPRTMEYKIKTETKLEQQKKQTQALSPRIIKPRTQSPQKERRKNQKASKREIRKKKRNLTLCPSYRNVAAADGFRKWKGPGDGCCFG